MPKSIRACSKFASGILIVAVHVAGLSVKVALASAVAEIVVGTLFGSSTTIQFKLAFPVKLIFIGKLALFPFLIFWTT